MATGKPVNLAEILARGNSPLSALARQADSIDRVGAAVRKALPEILRPHLVGASIHGDTLVVIADTAAWAARLRFYATDVLSYMAVDHNSAASQMKVITRPPG